MIDFIKKLNTLNKSKILFLILNEIEEFINDFRNKNNFEKLFSTIKSRLSILDNEFGNFSNAKIEIKHPDYLPDSNKLVKISENAEYSYDNKKISSFIYTASLAAAWSQDYFYENAIKQGIKIISGEDKEQQKTEKYMYLIQILYFDQKHNDYLDQEVDWRPNETVPEDYYAL